MESFPADNPDFHKDNFAKGWTELIGTLLPDFVETANIEKSILINANADIVWNVLTNHDKIRQWASAFSEGTYVETDWTHP